MSARRKFGTELRFESDGRGRWFVWRQILDVRGGGGTPVTGHLVWARACAYIERRRSEPGHPAGWYYFGPGASDGERAGEYVENAARLASERLDVSR